MRGGIRGNCSKCGSITEIISLDSEILCPMCLLETLDKKISDGEIDEDFLELWKNFKKIAKPLFQRYA